MRITENEMAALMHQNTANALTALANHFTKYDHSKEEIVDLLFELSDDLTAQIAVCETRDFLAAKKNT